MNEVKIGGIYRHYKNKLYKVHGLARHSETLEQMVYYECLYENPAGQMWVRPLDNFTGKTDVTGTLTKRFTLVEGAEIAGAKI